MFGLIGKKLSHSFSKEIHEKLHSQTYNLIELNQLDSFFQEKPFTAINVTIPYKSAVIPFLDPQFIDVRDSSNSPNAALDIANQVYPQVFSDKIEFLPNCSILDLLFCIGPSANIYLKDSTL